MNCCYLNLSLCRRLKLKRKRDVSWSSSFHRVLCGLLTSMHNDGAEMIPELSGRAKRERLMWYLCKTHWRTSKFLSKSLWSGYGSLWLPTCGILRSAILWGRWPPPSSSRTGRHVHTVSRSQLCASGEHVSILEVWYQMLMYFETLLGPKQKAYK